MSDMSSNELANLINTAEDANGWSDTDVARRANERGEKLSSSNISLIRTDGIKTLVPAQLRALATGLDIPLERVVRAALATTGLPVPTDIGADLADAVRADETLSLEVKRIIVGVLAGAQQANNLKVARRRKKSP